MGCCGDREKFGSATNEQRWDYVNLSDFKSTSCWSPLSYGIVYVFLIISVAVYAVDLYTAANLLFFERWSSQVKPAIPFQISRWVFAGCIFLSWILLVYRWWRALRAMRTGVITASYLDPLAVRIESVRLGKGQGWRRFLVFTALTKGRKGSEYVALFTYFSFEAWLRIVFAEGPRQVINALTLYSVLQAKLIPVGAHAPNDGHTPVVQFFVNVKILANASTQQATILFGMLYVLIIWLFSAISLALAFLMYITFLWHHIPSADGSLTRFCRRKIEKRLNQIVRQRVDKAIAKEHKARIEQVATGGTGASVGMPATDFKRQPTLPVLDTNPEILPSQISRQITQSNLNPFEGRPASPFGARPASPRPSNISSVLQREPTVPDITRGAHRPGPPSRNTTQSSLHSNASYGSDAPLMSSAGEMGCDVQRPKLARNGSSRIKSDRSMSSGRPPPSRDFTDMSQSTQRPGSARPSRVGPLQPQPRAGMSGRNNTSAPCSSQTPSCNPTSRDPSTSLSSIQRRPPGSTGFSRRPPQEYEMHAPTPTSGMVRPPPPSGRNGGYVPFNPSLQPLARSRNLTQPYRPPPMDYFGESRVPPRAGTAPVAHTGGYDDSIYDAYIAGEPQEQPSEPFRPATAGPVGGTPTAYMPLLVSSNDGARVRIEDERDGQYHDPAAGHCEGCLASPLLTPSSSGLDGDGSRNGRVQHSSQHAWLSTEFNGLSAKRYGDAVDLNIQGEEKGPANEKDPSINVVVARDEPRSQDNVYDRGLKLSPEQLYNLTSSPTSLPLLASPNKAQDASKGANSHDRTLNTRAQASATAENGQCNGISHASGERERASTVANSFVFTGGAPSTTPSTATVRDDIEHPPRSQSSGRAVSTSLLRKRVSVSKETSSDKTSVRRQKGIPPALRFDNTTPPSKASALDGPEPSPMPQSIPIPPFSLPTYLQLELSSERPSPLYIHRSVTSDFPYESSRVKIDRLKNFMLLPPQLEQVLWFGAFACMDAWLFSFTILPLRFLKALYILAHSWSRNLAKEVRYISGFIFAGSGRMWRRRRRGNTTESIPANSSEGKVSSEATLAARSALSGDSNMQHRHRKGTTTKHRRSKPTPSALSPDHKADILKGLLILLSCIILMYFDASRMYHGIRGQAAIKLYVIYNVLEVCDRLFSALGQDVLECLFSKEALERKADGRSKVLRPFWLFVLALAYNLVHSTALFYQVITLNVAVNSYSNALLTLLMSNQFVEIKSTVFKKFEKENLFQLTCADVVERFQLWLMLMIIASRNIIETGGLSLLFSSSTAGGETVSAPSSSILPKSFTLFPSWTGQVLAPFFLVLGSEMLVDWLKHAYITKFNNTKPAIYGRFLDVLAKDYYSNAFADHNLTRRLGLPVIPLACLFIRASVQIYHMFLATHMPPPLPSTATSLSAESATTSPATTAALDHIDNLFRRALHRPTLPLSVSSYPSYALDLLLPYLLPLTTLLLVFLFLLSLKLLLGMALLSFARGRYKSMKERESVSVHAEGRRVGGWGVVEVDEDKRRWIYADDPDGARGLRERELREREKGKGDVGEGFGGVERYIFTNALESQVQCISMEVDAHRPNELDCVDDATASLILQLQNSDIEELLSASKGKSREGEFSDADLAVAIYQKELQERNAILADRCMSRSVAQAVITDAALLSQSLAEERTAAGDRVLAHRLAGIVAPAAAPVQMTEPSESHQPGQHLDGSLRLESIVDAQLVTHGSLPPMFSKHHVDITIAENACVIFSSYQPPMKHYSHLDAVATRFPLRLLVGISA
ncbi:MAG: hypothetical protein Q9217_003936 [Psora testacea]